jgi:hypothetical protein
MMNERIKEFAEQAGIEFTYDPTETPMLVFAECWENELCKFAELIVQGCADLCVKHETFLGPFNVRENRKGSSF